MAEKLTYPFKVMRITQNYNGTTSHKPHTTGNIKDYPIDEGGKDAGRDPVYAPCNLVVKRIYGVGTGGTNTVWLESAEKVELANGKTDYITLMLTHPNDSDLKKIKVGQIFKKGDIICYEGTDGATGNHIHMSVGMGKYQGNGWVLNSNSKWVLNCSNGAVKPEDAFYVDKSFTTIKDAKSLKFKDLPKETTTSKAATYTKGNYKVTATLLKVRSGAGLNYSRKLYANLTADAKKKILKLNGNKPADGYVKGVEFTATSVTEKDGYHWGKTASGYVALEYCVKI